MKRIKIFLFVVLLASSASVFALSRAPRTQHPRRCVSVPLDGGILGVLAVAGIVYFVVRKKGNKKEE